MVFFVFVLFLQVALFNAQEECGTTSLTIAIDQSSSLGTLRFQNQIHLFERIVNGYVHSDTYLSVIQFGTKSTITDSPRMFNPAWMKQRFSQMKHSYWPDIIGGQYTNTPQMLEQALSIVQTVRTKSPLAKPVLVVVTDGSPCTHSCGCARIGCSLCPKGKNPNSTETWPGTNINKDFSPILYQKVRDSKLEVFIVAVGAEVLKENLVCMLKKEHATSHYIESADLTFLEIARIAPKFAQPLCPKKISFAPTTAPFIRKCETKVLLDVVFGIDQSTSLGKTRFKNQIDFIKSLTKKELSEPNIHHNFGIVEFGSDVNIHPLRAYKNRQDFDLLLDGLTYWPYDRSKDRNQFTNIPLLLEESLKVMHTSSSVHANVLVVVTDGNPCLPQCRCRLPMDGCSLCPNGGPNPKGSQTHVGSKINRMFHPTLWQRVLDSNVIVIIVAVGNDINRRNVDCMLKHPASQYIAVPSLVQPKDVQITVSRISHVLCTIKSSAPTIAPTSTTQTPSKQTSFPTGVPSTFPSILPTASSAAPSTTPSFTPSSVPSSNTRSPTFKPTGASQHPSQTPSKRPTTLSPSRFPSMGPTQMPSLIPTLRTKTPSNAPTISPTIAPTNAPTASPIADYNIDFRAVCLYDQIFDQKTNAYAWEYRVNVTFCNRGDEEMRNVLILVQTFLPGFPSIKYKKFHEVKPRHSPTTHNCLRNVLFRWTAGKNWDRSHVGRTFLMYTAVSKRGQLLATRRRTLFNGWCKNLNLFKSF